MNDVLNFKSITTYRVALPLKFEFKTAKGAVRLRESIIIRIEDQQAMLDTGMCGFHRSVLYTEAIDSDEAIGRYILALRLMRPKHVAYVGWLQFS
ncbi:MAG: hypothetical protein ACLR5T_04780 [Veillonella sp.]